MNGTRRILRFVVLFFVSSCASTKVTSAVAPDLEGKTFHRVLVVFPLTDLGRRRLAESEFGVEYARRFVDSGLLPDSGVFTPSNEVFFPGRQYTSEEVSNLLKTKQIDAALVIVLNDAGTTTSPVPTRTTAQCTVWTSTQGCTSATAITTGGYDLSKPWASFTAVLVDVSTGKVVWTSTANSRGNAFAGTDDLLRSMARKTLQQLLADSVVR